MSCRKRPAIYYEASAREEFVRSSGGTGRPGEGISAIAMSGGSTAHGISELGRRVKPMDSSARNIRIVIADDHTMFRDGLRRVLETDPHFQIVGEAADGLEAVRRVRELAPDILLLDLSMPRHSGWEALQELERLALRARTVVVAAAMDKDEVVEALRLGARGVVLKESASELLVDGIRAVMAGDYWVGDVGVSELVQAVRRIVSHLGRAAQHRNFGLTEREMEIMAAVVGGYANKDIAQSFCLSERTIKNHLTNIFDKLGVSSRLELALFAVNHQLVTHDSSLGGSATNKVSTSAPRR